MKTEYKWGVEYPTNGKKPELVDDVCVQIKECGTWHEPNSVAVDQWEWHEGVTHFRIVDKRYKPKEPERQTKNAKDLSDVIFAVSDAISVAVDAGAMPAARELQKINRDLLAKDSVVGIDRPELQTKPNNSWHDRGELPPAGSEIEVFHNEAWTPATVIGEFGTFKKCVVCAPNGGGFFGFYIEQFRPIKTDREKFIQAVVNALHYSHATTDKERAERIYELGVRLVSQESSK